MASDQETLVNGGEITASDIREREREFYKRMADVWGSSPAAAGLRALRDLQKEMIEALGEDVTKAYLLEAEAAEEETDGDRLMRAIRASG